MRHELIDLVEAGRRIVARAAELQDTTGLSDQFPLAERRALAESLSTEYHTWYAKAQASLPAGDCLELAKLYEGSFFSPGIKGFLTEPLATNPLHNDQTAQLMPFWLHPYAGTFKSRMVQQITILERRAHNRPAVLKVGGNEVALPRNLSGHQVPIENFLGKYPFEQNVFLMMKYREENRHVADILRAAVEGVGLRLWLASDVQITDELATNVVACLLCCKFGIALFDEPEEGQHINPNVAYELGMLHLLDRPCLILKSTNVSVQSDILAKLYVSYDSAKPGELIGLTKRWLTDVGGTRAS